MYHQISRPQGLKLKSSNFKKENNNIVFLNVSIKNVEQ